MENSEPVMYKRSIGAMFNAPIIFISFFSCVCGWKSPVGFGETPEKSVKNAFKKAQVRSPRQSPLTLDELRLYESRPVFIESGRKKSESSPVKIDTFKWVLSRWTGHDGCAYISFVTACIPDNDGCYEFSLRLKDYGKTWRCWATRPTDEEREAAAFDKRENGCI